MRIGASIIISTDCTPTNNNFPHLIPMILDLELADLGVAHFHINVSSFLCCCLSQILKTYSPKIRISIWRSLQNLLQIESITQLKSFGSYGLRWFFSFNEALNLHRNCFVIKVKFNINF